MILIVEEQIQYFLLKILLIYLKLFLWMTLLNTSTHIQISKPIYQIVKVLFCFSVVGFDQSKLQKCFSIFEYYCCFHVQEKKLVNILQDIMLYQDDELRIASVTLLFDIYSVSRSVYIMLTTI